MTKDDDELLREAIVDRNATILECMRVSDRTGLRTALICDADRRLLGLVTDGDVRRFLLRGGSLDGPAWDAATQDFTAVGPNEPPSNVLRILVDRGVPCVPALDEAGRLVRLHTFRSLARGRAVGSWAIVMAGGRGERLGELTTGMPKPMLPVDGRPLLEHVVAHLVEHGVRRVFLSISYLGTMIEDHFADGSALGCRIEYLRETTPLGSGGPLALLPETPTEPLVVMNGDLLTRINVTRMLAFHRQGGFSASLAVREHVVDVPFGVVRASEGRVEALEEKPKLSYDVNAGIYVLEPALLARVPQGRPFPITELWQGCLDDGLLLGAYSMQEDWIDIGRPEQYAAASESQRPPQK